MKDIWVLEYSTEQKAVHVDTLANILESNLKNMILGISTEYAPIFASLDREKVDKYAEILKDIRDKKERNEWTKTEFPDFGWSEVIFKNGETIMSVSKQGVTIHKDLDGIANDEVKQE